MNFFRLCCLFASLLLSASCGPYLLRSGKAGGLELGGEFDRLYRQGWQKLPGRDTLFDEGGYRWRGLMWETGDGFLLVEEDFLGQGLINRIRVESPKFRTRSGIRVGQTLGRLLTEPGPWTCQVLPGYNLLDYSSPAFPGLHFLVAWSGVTPEPGHTACDLDPSLPIVSIVVM